MIPLIATAGTGVLEGGWSYINAAYIATWLFLVGYAVSLQIRGTDPGETR